MSTSFEIEKEKSILVATEYWKKLRNKAGEEKDEECRKVFCSEKTSFYAGVVAATELMPADMFRRWLRWSNTDFQGFDLFLTRITLKQAESLKEHVQAFLSGTEKENLPCYKDGFRNLAWKVVEFFVKEPITKTPEKYQESCSIKHDFAGIGFGFPEYPKTQEGEEKTEPSKLENFFRASGFDFLADMVSGDPTKGFEVNQEELGLYFIFYRHLRSNTVWNSGKDVVLSPYICPGFWITLAGWAGILVLSPLFLVAAVFSYGVYFWVFLLLGMITPALLVSWGVIHMLRNTSYSYAFWNKIWEHVGVLFLSGLFLFISFLAILGKITTLGVILFWLFVWAAHKEESPFKLPGLGKWLRYVLVAAVIFDLYIHRVKIFTNVDYTGLIAFVVTILSGVTIFFGALVGWDKLKSVREELGEVSLKKQDKLNKVVNALFVFSMIAFVVISSVIFSSEHNSFELFIKVALSVAVFFFGVATLLGLIYHLMYDNSYVEAVRDYLRSVDGINHKKSPYLSYISKNKKLFSEVEVNSDLDNWQVYKFLRELESSPDIKSYLKNVVSAEAVLQTAFAYGTPLGKAIWYSGLKFRDMFASGNSLEQVAVEWKKDLVGDFTKDENGTLFLSVPESHKLYRKAHDLPDIETEKIPSKAGIFFDKVFDFFNKMLMYFGGKVVSVLRKIVTIFAFVPAFIYAFVKMFKEGCPKISSGKVYE